MIFHGQGGTERKIIELVSTSRDISDSHCIERFDKSQFVAPGGVDKARAASAIPDPPEGYVRNLRFLGRMTGKRNFKRKVRTTVPPASQ
jgi:hypothetical protein